MDKLKEFDLNKDGHTDLGEIAMGIELIKGKNNDLTDEIKDMEEEVLEDIVAEE